METGPILHSNFHIQYSIFQPYTVVRSLRPFCLRAFKTSRPLLVAERTKKPCVVALFFFFGWYVCDIIYNSTLKTIQNQGTCPPNFSVPNIDKNGRFLQKFDFSITYY